MERKETIRKTLCIIFSFLLSVVLFSSVLVSVARLTVLDRDFFVDALEKSGYSENLRREIAAELSEYGYMAGFDEDFFLSVITYEKVNAPVLSSADRIYGAGEYKAPSVAEFAEELTAAFTDDLEKRGVEMTEELAVSLKGLAAQCSDFYASNARLPFISVAEGLVSRSLRLVNYARIFLVAFSLFCVLFLLFINPKKNAVLKYLSYAFGGAALMTAAPSAMMLITGILKKVSIQDKALYTLVQFIGDKLIYIVLAVAATLLVCSVLCAVAFFVRERSKQE